MGDSAYIKIFEKKKKRKNGMLVMLACSYNLTKNN